MKKLTYFFIYLIMLVPLYGLAQTRTIQGRVTDAQTGEALAGASVVANTATGREQATSTDESGAYRIQVSENATTLVFAYVGKTTLTEQIGNRTSISVQLESDAGQLDEVIVTGYSTTTKATLTGAVSSIGGDDMIRTKNENVVNMLTGKVPGLRVQQRSSAPGDYSTRLDIRGMGDPLVVVDGIPRDKDYFSRMSGDEIESVSVLKDGTAAIYGLRAANGVILVTTKSGGDMGGKVDITFSTNTSLQQFLNVPQTTNAIDYFTLRNERNWQDFGGNYMVRRNPLVPEEQFQPYLDGTLTSYNWMDKVFKKTTPQSQHNLSVNGGSDKIQYFFNLGYSKQSGSYRSDDYNSDRWNMRSNIDAQITKRLKARVSLGGIMLNTTKPNGVDWTAYKNTWLTRPNASFYANDNPLYPNGDPQVLNESVNPMVQTDADYVGYNLNKDRRFNGTFQLEYQIPGVDGLSAKGSYDYAVSLPDYHNYHRVFTVYQYNRDSDTYSPIQKGTPATVTRGVNINNNTNMQLGLFYNKSFGLHNFNNFLLYEETYSNWDSFSAFREMHVDSEYLFAGADANQRAQGGGVGDRSSKSMVGQIDYNYASKYMFAFKFRYDGSSRFPEGKRFGFFPSVSGAWRVSQENFMKDNVDFVNELKIRASYGEMGDDNAAGNYPPTLGYNLDPNAVGWVFNGGLQGGVTTQPIPNPNLTWYQIKSYNVGLDVSFLQNKLNATFDLFQRDRSGLLATSGAVIPATVGANLPQENLNGDRNYGYEVSLDYRSRVNEFYYNVGGQISATRIKRTDWLETPANNSYDYWRNRTAGRFTNIWWGTESGGMFTNYEDIRNFSVPQGQGALPGDWYLNDWNEDGVINDQDNHPIASIGLPVFNYGISLGASWRGIDLALDFQGVHGVFVKYNELLVEALPFGEQNTLSFFMDRWRPVDPNADYFDASTEWVPGFFPVTGHDGRRTGTNGIQSAAYMRLKTAELGYTLPDRWVSKAGVKNLRIYFSGYNLLTFTGLDHMDPERPGQRINNEPGVGDVDLYNYPNNKTYTFGASIKF
ncbi:SusC/RagA family TonB-linked outer membrane protein [Parapedobacter defluvii]|uniref:SusC/RagA family TonB-linked outer membrane protein n=1 Tax=Parapedobacter defluvii TaxID=2045106 RepID=A0ABQ1LFL0_9SPHI|nr:TonB-dependent receptor [Parapedobacter defluvii]GGC23984.1 SusC/RagA family TonB-linked outer membrane protein [Parapedobacter defluvii]